MAAILTAPCSPQAQVMPCLRRRERGERSSSFKAFPLLVQVKVRALGATVPAAQYQSSYAKDQQI